MAETFSIAIIGAGGIANAHMGAAKATNGKISVSAAVDPVEANRQKAAEQTGGQGFASVTDLLAARGRGLKVDAAVVCTPPFARVEIVESLLAAGVPVLSEKPLAHTAADARRLAETARKHANVKTAVAYCHRYTPAVREMQKLVAQGAIGTLVRFENIFACDLPGHESKWFSDPKSAGGGALIDMGSHSLDLLHFLVGPSKVRAAVFHHKWAGRTETSGTILTRSTEPARGNIGAGVAGSIVSGWAEPARFTVALVGTGGMLSYDYDHPTTLVHMDLANKKKDIAVESHELRFQRQLEAFAELVRTGKESGAASFAEGYAIAQMIDDSNRLAAQG